MIIVSIRSGLGGQMFMYSIGRHLSIKNNCELKFDVSWWDKKNRNKPRNPSICNYNVKGEIASEEDIKNVLRPGNLFIRLKDQTDPTRLGLQTLQDIPNIGHKTLSEYYNEEKDKKVDLKTRLQNNKEATSSGESINIQDRVESVGLEIHKRFPKLLGDLSNYYRDLKGTPSNDTPKWGYAKKFNHRVLEIRKPAYLEGYWNSPKYFDDISDVIKDDLTLNKSLTGLNSDISNKIYNTNSVGLHIRRGDAKAYTNEAASDQWGSTPEQYVNSAVSYLSERVSEPHFFVFSETPQWAKEHVKLEYPTTYVTHNDGHTDYFDLELMKRCDHNITAGSAFSWWAAWLNQNSDKIVTAPDPWTPSANKGEVKRWDLIPKGWKIIEYQ